jgi:hypothetical protein
MKLCSLEFPGQSPLRGTARKSRRLLKGDAADEGIGMPVRQLPFGPIFPIDLGHAQRPVLLRQAADFSALSLDHDQNGDLL